MHDSTHLEPQPSEAGGREEWADTGEFEASLIFSLRVPGQHGLHSEDRSDAPCSNLLKRDNGENGFF